MSETEKTHTLIVGAGPGGYVASIRLGQLGIPHVLVDKAELGGTCLNIGCIPSKALISGSLQYEKMKGSAEMGLHAKEVTLDLSQMMRWKGQVVKKLTQGVAHLVRANGGRVMKGEASFLGPHLARIKGDGGETELAFQHVILATGSVPKAVPGFDFDGENILSSTEALSFESVPESLMVVGGGYIGMELGGVWQRLGTKVTVVEFQDEILPIFPKDLVRPVRQRFLAQGGEILTETAAKSWEKQGNGKLLVTLLSRKDGKAFTRETDHVLLTVGRVPYTGGLQLEKLGLATNKGGFLDVDHEMRTRVPHVFAIGDLTGEPLLAHVASRQAEIAAEVIAGEPSSYDAEAIPAVVFTDPEIATVGLSLKEAEEAGYKVKVGKFPFSANGRALSLRDSDGFIRTFMDEETGILLGVEAVGPEVSNLIAESSLAIEMGAEVYDIAATIHAHPTLAEASMESAKAALGQAIHAIQR